MAVQDVESRFLASIDTESVEQVGAGDVLVILSGDPRHGALHRVPEITKDRLFLQIYALSSESTAEVMWMDQMRRVGEVFRAAT